MAKVIRVGDTSSHGGQVISGSFRVIANGAGVARQGDLHVCPLPGHSTTPIVSGSSRVLADGLPVAYAGCVTGCGAVLQASPGTTVEVEP
ncbi:PAAR domain-containing protein [Thermus sp. PS18]|uniref:PAAR domain-containing protein n=1 Tax=Thermus sp. PS18 TaxID=2849039 RepID=UPI0022654202|nr:PAAR domain-containing protein [Thermus sp. PS18]UZX16565.1 PAAR domain-containing protein [Thermus sp. PS18]